MAGAQQGRTGFPRFVCFPSHDVGLGRCSIDQIGRGGECVDRDGPERHDAPPARTEVVRPLPRGVASRHAVCVCGRYESRDARA